MVSEVKAWGKQAKRKNYGRLRSHNASNHACSNWSSKGYVDGHNKNQRSKPEGPSQEPDREVSGKLREEEQGAPIKTTSIQPVNQRTKQRTEALWDEVMNCFLTKHYKISNKEKHTFKEGWLQKDQIIVHVPLGVDEKLEWCNSFVLGPIPNEKVWLCLDPARLNQALIRLVQRGPIVSNIPPRVGHIRYASLGHHNLKFDGKSYLTTSYVSLAGTGMKDYPLELPSQMIVSRER